MVNLNWAKTLMRCGQKLWAKTLTKSKNSERKGAATKPICWSDFLPFTTVRTVCLSGVCVINLRHKSTSANEYGPSDTLPMTLAQTLVQTRPISPSKGLASHSLGVTVWESQPLNLHIVSICRTMRYARWQPIRCHKRAVSTKKRLFLRSDQQVWTSFDSKVLSFFLFGHFPTSNLANVHFVFNPIGCVQAAFSKADELVRVSFIHWSCSLNPIHWVFKSQTSSLQFQGANVELKRRLANDRFSNSSFQIWTTSICGRSKGQILEIFADLQRASAIFRVLF